jgi:hypothetical protein
MTDDKQLARFRQAVEDKNEEAAERSEQGGQPDGGDHPEPSAPANRGDVQDERTKSSRHGGMTADNWNQ